MQLEKASILLWCVCGWLKAARLNGFVNPVGSYLGFHPLHGFPMGNIDTFETICNHFTLHIFFTILSLDLIFMWNVIFSILFLKCFQTILWLLSVVMTSECAPGILWFSSSYTSNTRLNWSFWQIRVRRDSWRKKTDYVWLSNKAPPPSQQFSFIFEILAAFSEHSL